MFINEINLNKRNIKGNIYPATPCQLLQFHILVCNKEVTFEYIYNTIILTIFVTVGKERCTIFCNILQYSAIFCNILQYSAIFCNILQYSAIFCNFLQYSAIFCNILQYSAISFRRLHFCTVFG